MWKELKTLSCNTLAKQVQIASSYLSVMLPKLMSLVCKLLEFSNGDLYSFFLLGTAHSLCDPTACRILVPLRGIKPVSPAVEVQSLNHWTAKEVPLTHS